MGVNARMAARFRVAAALFGMTFATKSLLVFSTNVAIEAVFPAPSTVSPSQSPLRTFGPKVRLIYDSRTVFYSVPVGNLSAPLFFPGPRTPMRARMPEMALQFRFSGHFPI
jgi:hypothetical protein